MAVVVCQSSNLVLDRCSERELAPNKLPWLGGHAAVVQRPAGREQNYMRHSESPSGRRAATTRHGGKNAHTSGKLLDVFNTDTCCLVLVKALTYPPRSPCFTGSNFLKSTPVAHCVSAQFGDYAITELQSGRPRFARNSWTQWIVFMRPELGTLEWRHFHVCLWPLSLSD